VDEEARGAGGDFENRPSQGGELAGYSPEDIGPLFSNVPDNVVLPETFWKHISR